MSHANAPWNCTVQRADGSFCDARGMADVPFPICGTHAYRLWRRMSEMVTEAERDPLRILSLAMRDIEEKHAREDRRHASERPVVYYLLLGDLLKIGTTVRLRERLHNYPPNRKLLAVEPGGYDVERDRHAQFSDLLAHGKEWFRFEEPLVAHVRNLRNEQAA